MFEKLSRLLIGYIRIKIYGDEKLRFLNIAIHQNFGFWDYESIDDCIYISLRISDFKKFEKLKKRFDVQIETIYQRGAIFFFNKIRLGFYVGFVFSIVMYLFLFSRYWVVEVSGNGENDPSKILETAKNYGIYIGGVRENEGLYNIEAQILRDLPELSWISINPKGCTVDIAVRYRTYPEEILVIDDTEPCNIVAKKAGTITKIEAYQGLPVVRIGSQVEVGDTLIIGQWDQNFFKDEWSEIENPTQFSVHSRGKIMAEVQETFTATLPIKKQVFFEEESYKRYNFGFFFFKIPFTANLVPSGNYEYYSHKENWNLLGVNLPLYVETETLKAYEIEEVNYTKEELETEFTKLLDKQIKEFLGDGESLISKGELSINCGEFNYSCQIDCIINENIAKLYKITTN